MDHQVEDTHMEMVLGGTLTIILKITCQIRMVTLVVTPVVDPQDLQDLLGIMVTPVVDPLDPQDLQDLLDLQDHQGHTMVQITVDTHMVTPEVDLLDPQDHQDIQMDLLTLLDNGGAMGTADRVIPKKRMS